MSVTMKRETPAKLLTHSRTGRFVFCYERIHPNVSGLR